MGRGPSDMSDETTAAILTLAHMTRIGGARTTSEAKYAHNEVVEEYEEWLDYIKNGGYNDE